MNLLNRMICPAVFIFLAFICAGCDAGIVATPESLLIAKSKTPDIRGEIIGMTKIDDTIHSIHVKGEIQTDTRFDEAGILLNDRTRIYAVTANGYEMVTRESLQVGQQVECILVMGSVLERDPIVGDAEEILILNPGGEETK